MRSVRVRAALALGAVGLLGTTGTYAYWTDDATITGTTFTSGVLDLQVNGADSYATTTLGMTGMVPGSTSAEVLTLKNNGSVPLTWTLSGGLDVVAGHEADAAVLAPALKLTITTGARSVSASGATCSSDSGVTVLYGPVGPLTALSTTPIVGTRQATILAGDTTKLCFQITFDATASSSLQGKTANATFAVTGTSDVS